MNPSVSTSGCLTGPARVSRVIRADMIERTDPLWITDDVGASITATVGAQRAETGGMLGVDRASGVISHFVFDEAAQRSAITYSPDVAFVNSVLKRWNAEGVRLAGFVHSHPDGFDRPSSGDLLYVERAMDAMPTLREFALPIIQPRRAGTPDFAHGFAVHRTPTGLELKRRPLRVARPAVPNPEHFVRVAGDVYDLELLSRSRIVVVGAGGSASFCEDMARIGVGQIVLIDPDRIEASNVATQKVRPSEVGAFKVRELARSICATSDHVRVLAIRSRVEDCLASIDRLLFGSLPGIPAGPPDSTLLCGFTDDFGAQALVNRIALHHGVPMLAAQVYARGAGLELSFAAPGITRACGRCVLGPRYRGILGGDAADVGSAGTAYAATAMLNAVKQDVAVALLLGTDSERLDDTRRAGRHPARRAARRLVDLVADRNLMQLRRDPDIADTLGLTTFDRALQGADPDRFAFGDTVWLRQEPEGPDDGLARCPDCGGTGDLNDAIGSFTDVERLDAELDPARVDRLGIVARGGLPVRRTRRASSPTAALSS